MGKGIIYFIECGKKCSVWRFVKSYRPKRWFRRERIEYTPILREALNFEEINDNSFLSIDERIRKEYQKPIIQACDKDSFKGRHEHYRFWVICKYNSDGQLEGYYSAILKKQVNLETDIEDATVFMLEKDANETIHAVRDAAGPGARICINTIYLDIENGLLTPIFMITCTSKTGKQDTKYFARIEGNRLRLVNTSNSAKRFSLQEANDMFEHLVTHNKNFLYAVLPVFKDKVKYSEIGDYVRKNNISRAVCTTLVVKKINK